MLNKASLDQFRISLRGELIQPQDEGYDAARKVYNGMIDRRPRLIARCSDVGTLSVPSSSLRKIIYFLLFAEVDITAQD